MIKAPNNTLQAYRLPKILANRLKKGAEKKGWSQSMVVREALDAFLKKLGV